MSWGRDDGDGEGDSVGWLREEVFYQDINGNIRSIDPPSRTGVHGQTFGQLGVGVGVELVIFLYLYKR